MPHDGIPCAGVRAGAEGSHEEVVRVGGGWVPGVEVVEEAGEEGGGVMGGEQEEWWGGPSFFFFFFDFFGGMAAAGAVVLEAIDELGEVEADGFDFVEFPAREVGEDAAQGFGPVGLGASVEPVGQSVGQPVVGLVVDVPSPASRFDVVLFSSGVLGFWVAHVVVKLETPKSTSDPMGLDW